MEWHVETVRNDDEWTREYVRDILSSRPSYLPPKQLRLGDTTATWFEGEPGIATIRTAGGTPDDRVVAESYLREWLRCSGIQQAQYTFSRLNKVANWDDIMAKAARLIRSGNVQLLRNGPQNVIGHVVGDHGEYQTELSREDPNSQTLTQWQCECPWDQFAWQRTRQWKKYEGRPCAHVLATWWTAQNTPLDEEYDPAAAGGIAPGGQGTLFDPGTAPGGGPRPGTQGQPQPQIAPVPQLSIPGVSVPPPTPQAPGPDILPPYPGNPLMPTPVSVPGNNPGGPQNPVQWPGGTFSSWKFANDEWDFSDQSEGGWKFVYNTGDGQGMLGGPNSYHMDMERELGAYQGNAPGQSRLHGGTVSPDGLLNVYYWPSKPGRGDDLTSMGPDRHPPRLVSWLQEQIPVQIRVPQNEKEMKDAIAFGSKIAAFENSDMVRLEADEYGVMEGKSEEHGAGLHKLIPRGSIGEVLGEDPTTGWVDVAFAGPQAQAGPMEPYHVRAWIEPGNLTPMPGVLKPGPFIKRRR